MKALLLLIVLLLAGFGVYQFYLKDHPVAWLPGGGTASAPARDGVPAPPVPTPAPARKDFKELSGVLQSDMDHIPHDLRDPRQMPIHAFDVKARVAPHLQEHEEYRTLTQVCDTIISADQDFGDRQGKCGLGKPGPGATAQERARNAAGSNAAVYQQQESLWEGRRRQADGDVRQKLASLENRRL